ncbi:N-acetylmuramoyl-L-alanine amidase [Amphibacillus sp. Q70]|uniref:N-acetylmuramoyl-L-alanine amidase n=1 Tax=Amphibacillus sp. Q70 TaxID=3453416 RepID=UPI003F86AF16
MSKLIIDPGHGGTDPGTSGFGVQEKEWTLKISLYQYERLKELGADVAITRTTDKTLDSGPRTNLIKDKYDYCISNHFNGFNGEARGVETIHSIHANTANATRLANAIVKVSGLPLRRVFSKEGNRGDHYFMHRLTGSTQTTIIEYGFMDNKEDHDFYKNDDNFYKVAEAVVKELCAILGVEYVEKGKSKTKPKPTPSKPSNSNKPYTGNSIVDYLISIDQSPTFLNRQKLADQHGISNYRGTADQNLALLKKLRSGSKPKKPAIKGDQKTNSVVDYLKSIKVDSSYNNRKKLAQANGISNYKGTASQNTQLLKKLRG